MHSNGSAFGDSIGALGTARPTFRPLFHLPGRAWLLRFFETRWRLASVWLLGALASVLLIRLCYGTGGKWQLYLSVFHGVAKYSAGGGGGSPRFWPWFTLNRLLPQIPLILALSVAGCIAVVTQLWRGRRAALTWKSNLPEVFLLVGALAALFMNPSPFPYNVLLLIPFAFLVAFKYAAELWQKIRLYPNLIPVAVSVVLFVHLLPFATATKRHLNYRNDRQRALMQLAETMTNPAEDPVYDGIGMIPTRPTIHYLWYLHSLNMKSFISGPGPKDRDMLRERPAPILIPSYRTDWLTEEDQAFFGAHYVSLADDFRVLGTRLPAGGGDFEILHSGRYWISSSSPASGQTASALDGRALSEQAVELTAGEHQLRTGTNACAMVLWIGPHLHTKPELTEASHESLFVNWY